MAKILQFDGRKNTNSKEKLLAISEEFFSIGETTEKPATGMWFMVNPKTIDRHLFQKKRKDPKQEEIRILILEAFTKVDENPEKYGKSFNTMIAEKVWDKETCEELESRAENLGDHLADWIEQSLEWAQRIQNGEWEICNKPDISACYRLIKWKDGQFRQIGNCYEYGFDSPATHIQNYSFPSYFKFSDVVPLVVSYNRS